MKRGITRNGREKEDYETNRSKEEHKLRFFLYTDKCTTRLENSMKKKPDEVSHRKLTDQKNDMG